MCTWLRFQGTFDGEHQTNQKERFFCENRPSKGRRQERASQLESRLVFRSRNNLRSFKFACRFFCRSSANRRAVAQAKASLFKATVCGIQARGIHSVWTERALWGASLTFDFQINFFCKNVEQSKAIINSKKLKNTSESDDRWRSFFKSGRFAKLAARQRRAV